MKRKIALSIVISNFNTRQLLLKTIKSIKKHVKKIPYEIIVVDDASVDRSAEFIKKKFPKITLIINKKNLGYSKSYNIGTNIAKGKYVLHLNSDITFLGKEKLDDLVKFMDNRAEVGITGCKILKPDGKIDLPCRRSFPTITNILWQTIGLSRLFPNNRFFGQYYLSHISPNKIQPVDCLMGAFMLIRKKVIKQIGLLDEQFFIYGEDIDYCYRAKQAGWQIYYNPSIVIKHHHGGTTQKSKIKHIIRFHKAMFLYYQKHIAKKNSFLINMIVYLGILIRTLGNFVLDIITKFKLFLKEMRRKGFTLIELLLVIAILGILAWLITPNMMSSLKKGRDARRKQDLNNIQKALEMYYEDKKIYPSALTFNAKFCETSCASGEKVYMQKVPDDPSSNQNYSYYYCPATDQQSYQLYTSLENIQDLQIITPTTTCRLNCGTNHTCNYGISTSNANP